MKTRTKVSLVWCWFGAFVVGYVLVDHLPSRAPAYFAVILCCGVSYCAGYDEGKSSAAARVHEEPRP